MWRSCITVGIVKRSAAKKWYQSTTLGIKKLFQSSTFSIELVGVYLKKKVRQSGDNSKLRANYKKDRDAGKHTSK